MPGATHAAEAPSLVEGHGGQHPVQVDGVLQEPAANSPPAQRRHDDEFPDKAKLVIAGGDAYPDRPAALLSDEAAAGVIREDSLPDTFRVNER
jgi:hypothetical protein